MLRRRRPTADPGLDAVADVLDGYELPSFSSVVTEALEALGDPDVDLRRVAGILELDPGLSVQLLRMANSSAMGLRSSVDSLDRAVAMLGRNQVESILIGQAVRSSISPRSPVLDQQRFWTTAATRGAVAAGLSATVDPPRRSEHFTAALLQDMALLVLVDHVDGYEPLLAGWYSGDIAELDAAETETFGWNHSHVGALMCERWGFPENLVEAVKHHHDDEVVSPSTLTADWHELDAERGPERLTARAGTIGLTEPEVVECLEEALESNADVAHIFA